MEHISKKFKSNNEDFSETFPLSKEKSSQGPLAIFINNPGLHHVAEEIFWNLNAKSLENCQQINQSSNQILVNPLFWMKKLVRRGGLSKENEEEWMKAIQLVKNSNKEEKYVAMYLKWKLKTKKVVDLPCYTNPTVQDDFRSQIWKSCRFKTKCKSLKKSTEIVKLLAPLTDHPNAPNNFGMSPIDVAKAEVIRRLLKSFKT